MGQVVKAGFSSHHIKYGKDEDRQAILDLVQWFGWKKALLIFRYLRDLKSWWEDSSGMPGAKEVLLKKLNATCFSVEMGGVSGHPVRRLFARFFGEKILQDWIES